MVVVVACCDQHGLAAASRTLVCVDVRIAGNIGRGVARHQVHAAADIDGHVARYSTACGNGREVVFVGRRDGDAAHRLRIGRRDALAGQQRRRALAFAGRRGAIRVEIESLGTRRLDLALAARVRPDAGTKRAELRRDGCFAGIGVAGDAGIGADECLRGFVDHGHGRRRAYTGGAGCRDVARDHVDRGVVIGGDLHAAIGVDHRTLRE